MSRYLEVTPFSMVFSAVGTTINTAYPNATLLRYFDYPNALGILNYQWSISVLNDNSGGNSAFYLILGTKEPLITIGQNNPIIASSYINGQTAAVDSSVNINYASNWKDYGFRLPAGQPISIYGSAPNSASYRVRISVNLYTTFIK